MPFALIQASVGTDSSWRGWERAAHSVSNFVPISIRSGKMGSLAIGRNRA
jgi:hypothetical protein